MLYYGSGVTWMSFFNIYLQQIGLSGAMIGLVGGVRPASMLISQPLWGVLADLWGRQRVLLLTLALGGLSLVGYMAGASLAFVLLWTIVFAGLSSPIGSLIDSLVLDHLAHRPGQTFGVMRVWGAVGWMVMAIVTGLAVAGRDLRVVFVLAGLMLLAGVAPARTLHAQATTAQSQAQTWRGAAIVLRNRRLLAALGVAVLAQMGIASYYTFFAVYLAELGASRPLIGFSSTVQGLSELPIFLLSGVIIARLGARRTLVLSLSIFAVRFYAYSVLDQALPAIAFGLTHGVSFSLMLVAFIGYVNQLTPVEWRATGQALFWAAFWGAGAIAGNAWAGLLYDRLGAQAVFRIDAMLLAAAALAALLVVRERGDGALAGNADASVTADEHR